jgi:phage terminase small subunit
MLPWTSSNFSADPDLCRGLQMPTLPNIRQERFAQELALGKSANDAYVAAGYKSNRGNADFLRRQQSISIRITEILEERAKIDAMATQIAAEKTGVDKAWGCRG